MHLGTLQVVVSTPLDGESKCRHHQKNRNAMFWPYCFLDMCGSENLCGNQVAWGDLCGHTSHFLPNLGSHQLQVLVWAFIGLNESSHWAAFKSNVCQAWKFVRWKIVLHIQFHQQIFLLYKTMYICEGLKVDYFMNKNVKI